MLFVEQNSFVAVNVLVMNAQLKVYCPVKLNLLLQLGCSVCLLVVKEHRDFAFHC